MPLAYDVFTTLRTPLHSAGWAAHRARLLSHAAALGLDVHTPEVAETLDSAAELAGRLGPARVIRVTVSPAPYLDLWTHPEPLPATVSVHQRVLPPLITAPFALTSVTYQKPLPHLKHTSVLEAIQLRRQAGTEVLWTSPDGTVTEASIANAWFWLDGAWVTPGDACLAGLARQRVLALAGGLGVPLRRGRVTQADLARAEAIFLSNAVRGGWRVDVLDGRPLPWPAEARESLAALAPCWDPATAAGYPESHRDMLES